MLRRRLITRCRCCRRSTTITCRPGRDRWSRRCRSRVMGAGWRHITTRWSRSGCTVVAPTGRSRSTASPARSPTSSSRSCPLTGLSTRPGAVLHVLVQWRAGRRDAGHDDRRCPPGRGGGSMCRPRGWAVRRRRARLPRKAFAWLALYLGELGPGWTPARPGRAGVVDPARADASAGLHRPADGTEPDQRPVGAMPQRLRPSRNRSRAHRSAGSHIGAGQMPWRTPPRLSCPTHAPTLAA